MAVGSGILRRVRAVVDGSRGAVAVEAALILPIFFVIVFSMVDLALVLRDQASVSSAVRTAGRTISAEPRVTMTTNYPKLNTVIADNVNQGVVDGVQAAISSIDGIPSQSVQELWFYQAAADGTPANANSTAGTGVCTTNCVRYRWDGALTWTDTTTTPATVVVGGFRRISGSWSAASINACIGTADNVGVYLKVRKNLILPWSQWLFGSTIDISDRATFKFEPFPPSSGACR